MIRVFLALLLSVFSLHATPFKERRYINSLDMWVEKNGNITFGEQTIELNYPNTTYLISKDEVFLDSKPVERSVVHELFYAILWAIYKDDFKEVSANFEVEQNSLIPKSELANVLLHVEYEKDDGELKNLKLEFKNGDKIEIIR